MEDATTGPSLYERGRDSVKMPERFGKTSSALPAPHVGPTIRLRSPDSKGAAWYQVPCELVGPSVQVVRSSLAARRHRDLTAMSTVPRSTCLGEGASRRGSSPGGAPMEW